MGNHYIKFYPVGNGDMTLVTTRSKASLLVDCNIRENSSDEMEDPKEVKEDLLGSIQRRGKTPFVDVFALTHPDQDHVRGFSLNFYTGNPEDYSATNTEKGEIQIDELWVTRRLFRNDICDDAKKLREEALRRKRLYDQDDPRAVKRGNRLVMIGYDGEESFDSVPHYYPGEEYDLLAGVSQEDFQFFVHAPLKMDVVQGTAQSDRNFTSMVLQLQFFANQTHKEQRVFAARCLLGGDADHYRWRAILDKTKRYDHEYALEWDVLLAPHHCSWTFFNDTPYDNPNKPENKKPTTSSLEILQYSLENAFVIASSKKIVNNDDNPPHYPAKLEYVKRIGDSNFLNTAIEPDEKHPKPIVFEIGLGIRRIASMGSEERKAALLSIGRKAEKPWVSH